MFVLGLEDADFDLAMQQRDFATLNQHLYRVQKISSNDYYFRFHTETSTDDKYNGVKNLALSKTIGSVIWAGCSSLISKRPHKVKVNILGEITEL